MPCLAQAKSSFMIAEQLFLSTLQGGRQSGRCSITVQGTVQEVVRTEDVHNSRQFSGSAEDFQDWSYQVRVLTKSTSEGFYSVLLDNERAKEEIDPDLIERSDVEISIRQASTEFFQILATHLQGEPLTLVRAFKI